MHRHPRDPQHFELLNIFDTYVQRHGLAFSDDAAESLLDHLRDTLQQHRNHTARLFGLRTESMFAHVAAALGECAVISAEDSGLFFDAVGKMRRPDFRIVTKAGHHFLVEVKNYHQNDPTAPYAFDRDYVSTLTDYAEACGTPLKFAVYWSRWNIWTLTSVDQLVEVDGQLQLSMETATMENEFYLLGDCMLGTTPPLAFRLHADPTSPRTIDSNGEGVIRIADAAVYAAGARVTDAVEQKLAWFCMFNGNWQHVTQPAQINDDLVDYLEFRVEPDPEHIEHPDQDFQMVGQLSQMISKQFVRQTSSDGSVSRLTPSSEPSKLGVLIPSDYKGIALKLWRFVIHPRSQPLDDIAS